MSISEILHKDGKNLPQEKQKIITDPEMLRSVYDHFHEITDLERQHLDLREYRLFFTGAVASNQQNEDSGENREGEGKNIS